MDSPSIDNVICRQDTKGAHRPEGWSLLEMMLVVTLVLIMASIATPIYRTVVVRAREAVLHDHLYSLRALIDEFTRDYGRAPSRLEELVEKGYLGRLPTDPFTGSNETWQVVMEDAPLSPTQTSLAIVDMHSGSNDLALDGTPTAVGESRIQERRCRAERRSAKVAGANGVSPGPAPLAPAHVAATRRDRSSKLSHLLGKSGSPSVDGSHSERAILGRQQAPESRYFGSEPGGCDPATSMAI